MHENLYTIRELGAEVYGVHGYDYQDSRAWEMDLGLAFKLLADPELALIRALGIFNRGRLPHPTTLIVDPGGVIRFRDVHVAYQDRTSAEVIITELKRLQMAPAGPPAAEGASPDAADVRAAP